MHCFFFQAEDGIRDLTVTGVQTWCSSDLWNVAQGRAKRSFLGLHSLPASFSAATAWQVVAALKARWLEWQIGRASCRERVEISVVAVSLKKKIKKLPGTYFEVDIASFQRA